MEELYNKESEEYIVGCMLVDSDTIPDCIDRIVIQDFYAKNLGIIFETIKEMFKLGKQVDIVTVSEELKFKGLLKTITRSYINELASNITTTKLLKQNIKILLKYSKKRFLLVLSDSIAQQVDNNVDVDNILKSSFISINDQMLRQTKQETVTLLSGVDSVMEEVARTLESEDGISGLSTGFNFLNKRINGLQKSKLYILGARPRVGKGYGLDTLTLTPTGWVKNRDIKLGDTVIGRDGKPTKVIGVYPQPLQDCYKITLKDGREVICDAPHEWTVYSSKWGRERTFTAEELYQKLQCVRYQKRISLPRFTGDYGIEKDFVIPPYIMGVLIGDGCLSAGDLSYCKPSQYVLKEVRRYLPDGVKANFRSDNKIVGITGWSSAKEYVKQVGLDTQCYNKFIPKEYFHSSKAQREELLKGLIDTDGFKFKTGWEYSTTSKQLALDVQQLAWSLGYCAKIITRMGKYKKDNQVITTRLSYRVFITSHNPLTIEKIEKVEPIPTQCIHVDNEDSLFVIEDYIVTHNSALAQQIAEHVAINHNVLFYSLEMRSEQYTKRSLFRRTGINQDILSTHRIQVNEAMDKLATASADLANLKLYINDKAECTLTSIELGILKMIKDKGSCDLLVIDYAQLMQSDERSIKDPFQIASRNCTGLKRLANKYNIPILLLAQLNRQVDNRADNRPLLSDLKDSGSYEQDADVIMFLYREELYKPTPMNRYQAELIIAKNREGMCSTIQMAFNGSKTEFKEM